MRDWERWSLTSCLTALALACALVWAGSTWGRPVEHAWTLPVAPGRGFNTEIWPIVLPDKPCSAYQPFCHRIFGLPLGGRWLAIWYEDRVAGTYTRLAVFTLPAWPLAAFTVAASLLLIAVARGWRLRGA